MVWEVHSATDSFDGNLGNPQQGALSNHALGALFHDVIIKLAKRGATIPGGSRLHRYAALFEGYGSEEGDPDERLEAMLDLALLEGLQFRAIADAIDDSEKESSVRDISRACGGALRPNDDQPHCRSRSLQFELYLRAWFKRAGLVAELREPDLMIQLPAGQILAVAAKRPRSPKKLVRNLKDGCEQVARTGSKGFVAMDLSLLREVSKPLYLARLAHRQVPARLLLDSYVYERRTAIAEAASSKPVIGVLFYYACVSRTVEPPPARLVSLRWLFFQTSSPPIPDADTLEVVERLQALGRES